MDIKKISYIVPCYNESEVLHEFYKRVVTVAETLKDFEFEFLFVNDGSTDGTDEILNNLSDKDSRVKVVHFSRNQGHQIALTAGMDFASGDMIISIDADLQDPPELAKEMLRKIQQGYDIVHAQRLTRRGEPRLKLFMAWLFYKLMSKFMMADLIENYGDFRAFNRRVLESVSAFRERHRFLRGTFVTIGFKQCIIQYHRDIRYAGESKYPFKKLFLLAVNGIFSFSTIPIKLITWLSFLIWGGGLIYLSKQLIDYFIYKRTVEAWAPVITVMTFLTGTILFCMSILGSYVGRIFEQGQKRPLYLVSDVRNIDIRKYERRNF